MIDEEAVETTETETPTPTPEVGVSDSGEPKPNGGASPETGDTPANWRDSIEDADLRKHAERFNTPTELAQAHIDLRKQLSSKLEVPKEDSSDEVKANFRKQLGVPETSEAYEMPEGLIEEGDDAATALVDMFRPIAHEANLSNDGFAKMVQQMNEAIEQGENNVISEIVKGRESGEHQLKTDWGPDYDGNVELSQRAVRDLGGEGVSTLCNDTILKDGSKLGDHPDMVRFFAKLGRQMNEDGNLLPVDGDAAKSMQEKIASLTTQVYAANNAGDRALARKLDEEQRVLIERLDGVQTVVGGGQRTL